MLAKDEKMLKNINECKVTMCSNGGNRNITQQGDWPGVGQAYLDGNALTNIVSLSEAVKRGDHVKFDSRVENCFTVTDIHHGRVTRYPCDERGLYVRAKNISHATTVEGFTQREVDRAVRARKLYHDLCAKNVSNVKMWIRSNQEKNVPVSVEDLNLVEGGRCNLQGQEHASQAACGVQK